MSTVENRKGTGLFGAFKARNPAGKVVGFLIAGVLCFGCWEWSKARVGPVGWAEKGLYISTAWDGFIDPILRPVHLGGNHEVYSVAVEDSPGYPLLTNEALAAGKKHIRKLQAIDPRVLHSYLREYVYDGDVLTLTWPVWFLIPILLVLGLGIGWVVDIVRLRKARQTGVFLRGNRMVGRSEWNSRAKEDPAG